MIPFLSSPQDLIVPPLVRIFSSSSASHAFGLSVDGLFYGTGKNNGYHLGIGHDVDVPQWRLISLYGVKHVACGGGFSLAVKKNGELWGCGQNRYGQLGLPLDVKELPVWTKLRDGVTYAAAGRGFSMIITEDKQLLACGDNSKGQLGTEDKVNRIEWTKVLDNVIDVSCGDSHTACIVESIYGTSGYVVGDNTYSQLGMPFVLDGTFMMVLGADPTSVSCGSRHTLFSNKAGNVFGCGDNRMGQLGVASYIEKVETLTLNDLTKGVKAVYGGNRHSMLIKDDGTLLATGSNEYGQIGLGESIPSVNQFVILAAIPQTTTTVAVGSTTSYCSTMDVTYATGDNYIGQVGNGNTDNVYSWTEIILNQ